MPVALQYKKTGGSVARLTQTFLSGECFFDTDVDGWFVGDAMTPGGLQVANGHITSIAVATQTVNNNDAGKLFVYSNAAGCTVALAAPSSTYFPLQSGFWLLNNSIGNVVVTATGATINGSATLTLFPHDSAVIVSDGTNYFAVQARTGFSASTPVDIAIVGNTTGATSSSTVFITGSTITAAGGISAGFSAGELVFSNPNVNATENDTALGNTTAATSSTTQPLGHWAISAAGDLSIGMSASSLIFSAPASATSTTARNAVALGNTTGATSSSVLTLTNMSLSGAAGVSIGFSTTAAAAGVLVVSQAPIGGSATGRNMSAVGNLAGTTSSQVATITGETWSFGGIVSGGFSAGTVVISGSLAGAPQYLSFYEPRPMLSLGTSSAQMVTSQVLLNPVNLPAQLTFNRVRLIASYNFAAAAFGPILSIATTAVSDTLTASASYAETFTAQAYSQVNSTQMVSFASGTISTGFSASASVSRSGSSFSYSTTLSVTLNADTNPSTTSISSSTTVSTTGAGVSVSVVAANPISTFFTGFNVFVIPLSASFNTGYNAVAAKANTGSGAGSMSTGASYLSIAIIPIQPFFLFCGAVGNSAVKTRAGIAAAPTGPCRPFGAGASNNTMTSYNPAAISTTGAAYAYVWYDLYLGS
jgi:hypothetical protein